MGNWKLRKVEQRSAIKKEIEDIGKIRKLNLRMSEKEFWEKTKEKWSEPKENSLRSLCRECKQKIRRILRTLAEGMKTTKPLSRHY